MDLFLYDSCCGHVIFEIIDYDGVVQLASSDELDCSIETIKQCMLVRDVLGFEGQGAVDASSLVIEGFPTVSVLKWIKGISAAISATNLYKIRLFVSRIELCNAITEKFASISCIVPSFVSRLFRLVRIHIQEFLLVNDNEYRRRSRDTIYSLTKSRLSANGETDELKIIQAVALLENLNAELQIQIEKIKNVYNKYFPALTDILPDDIEYCKFITITRDRLDFVKHAPVLISSFGVSKEQLLNECAQCGLINHWRANDPNIRSVIDFSDQVVETCDYRNQLNNFLEVQMAKVAPNITTLVNGGDVGSRLLSKFGSVSAISKLSSSEIQMAGAMRALTNARVTKTSTPKYGFIFSCPLMLKADAKVKGKLARALASKVALAARIDSLCENADSRVGSKYLEELEKRFIRVVPHKIHRLNEVVEATKLYALNDCDRLTLKRMNIDYTDFDEPQRASSSHRGRKHARFA